MFEWLERFPVRAAAQTGAFQRKESRRSRYQEWESHPMVSKSLVATVVPNYCMLLLDAAVVQAIIGLREEEEPIGWDSSGRRVLVREPKVPFRSSAWNPHTGT